MRHRLPTPLAAPPYRVLLLLLALGPLLATRTESRGPSRGQSHAALQRLSSRSLLAQPPPPPGPPPPPNPPLPAPPPPAPPAPLPPVAPAPLPVYPAALSLQASFGFCRPLGASGWGPPGDTLQESLSASSLTAALDSSPLAVSAAVVGTQSAANALAAAWHAPKLSLHQDGAATNPDYSAASAHKNAAGVQTLATMRAA